MHKYLTQIWSVSIRTEVVLVMANGEMVTRSWAVGGAKLGQLQPPGPYTQQLLNLRMWRYGAVSHQSRRGVVKRHLLSKHILTRTSRRIQ